jgi:V8-like Glu-specific endopeptidase
MIRSKLVSALALLCLSSATATYAADTTMPAGFPVIEPDTPKSATVTQPAQGALPPNVLLLPKSATPASADQLIDDLGAVRFSRDGKQMDVDVPARLRNMLRAPRQEGVIPTGGKGKLVQIKDTRQFPYTTMGVFTTGCSGTIVAKRFVLTAAFCLFDRKAQKPYDNLDFYPALNGNEQPYGIVKWKSVWLPKGFLKDGNSQYDFGLVELASDIGDQTGWFGFGHFEKFDFKELTLTGYPWEGVPDWTLWQSLCQIDAAEPNFLFYRCPGQPAALETMTGSAIWYKGAADDAWQILAIHNYAQNDKKDSWWALRLNLANTQTIIAWIDAANKGGGDQTGGDEEGGTEKVTDKQDCTCDQQ